MTPPKPTLIGWKESIDLPEWGIYNVTAKADTGARRSAIDVTRIHELPDNRVQFEVAIARRGAAPLVQTVLAQIAHQTHVRSSNGQVHERYFVQTTIRLGTATRSIELSLTCRRDMQCRMLLGREALAGAFLVDPSASFLTRPNLKPRLAPQKRR